jgi:hypothetical protein
MQPEEIISFFASRGHHVVRTTSCWWYEEQRHSRLYYSFPTHHPVDPSRQEIAEFFSQAPRAVGIRFLGSADARRAQSFVWVRRPPFDLNVLAAKARNQTRRGMEACEVRPLSWDQLIASARKAHTDTMNRHEISTAETLGFDVGLAGCPAYEAWGAFVEGDLAAYAVTLSVEDWAHILIHRSMTSHLKSRPNNALIFSVVREVLSRRSVSTVSYGLEPLKSIDSLEHFKLGMGFSKEPVCQRIVLAPRLKLVVNPLTARPLEALAGLLPNNPRLQRVAGFCRMARHG